MSDDQDLIKGQYDDYDNINVVVRYLYVLFICIATTWLFFVQDQGAPQWPATLWKIHFPRFVLPLKDLMLYDEVVGPWNIPNCSYHLPFFNNAGNFCKKQNMSELTSRSPVSVLILEMRFISRWKFWNQEWNEKVLWTQIKLLSLSKCHRNREDSKDI